VRFISVCHGLAWHVRLHAQDPRSRDWLIGTFQQDPWVRELPPPATDDHGRWLFEEPAAEEDPGYRLDGEIDIRFRCEGDIAEVIGFSSGRETTLTNRVTAGEFEARGGPVQIATVEQTLWTALRWFLNWQGLGCVHLGLMTFPGRCTRARAYHISDPSRWIDAGATLPEKTPAEEVPVVFIGTTLQEKALVLLDEVLAGVEHRIRNVEVDGGVFIDEARDPHLSLVMGILRR